MSFLGCLLCKSQRRNYGISSYAADCWVYLFPNQETPSTKGEMQELKDSPKTIQEELADLILWMD